MNMENLLLNHFINSQKLKIIEFESSRLRIEAARSKKRFDFYVRMWMNREKRFRSAWSVVELSLYWEQDVPKFTNEKFVNSFRVDRDTFDFLIQNLQELAKQETSWRSPIPMPKRVAIALYSLGSSAENITIASLFGVGRSTVGEITLQVCEEIYTVFQKHFLNFYPPNEHDMLEIVKGFEVLGFPQCSGAIDGCHIEVKPPKDEAVDYFHFKGWYSIILFAAVDYRYRFTYINFGSPGITHDSTIFECSSLKKQYLNNPIFERYKRNIEGVDIPILLFGDSAFKLSKYVMKPFPYNVYLSESEKCMLRGVCENDIPEQDGMFYEEGLDISISISVGE